MVINSCNQLNEAGADSTTKRIEMSASITAS